jgi:hypothetical protein
MPSTLALIAFIIVIVTGPAVAQGTPSPKQSLPTSSPRADILCDKEEAKCLRQLANVARRDGNHLRLTLANGQTKTFTTTQAACKANLYEKCLVYRLTGYFARHRQFLVDVGFLNHGGTTFLVSYRTGNHIRLDAPPHYSPTGKRLAAISASEGDDPNSIEILTATDPPKSEWRYVVPIGEYALYEFVGWDGDERLKLAVTTRIGGKFHQSLSVEAIRTPNGWSLTQPVPPQQP